MDTALGVELQGLGRLGAAPTITRSSWWLCVHTQMQELRKNGYVG
jgi:hypothetical protein